MVESWIPYCGAAPVPAELWQRWNFDPVLLAILAAGTAWLFTRPNAERHRIALLLAGAVFLFVSPFCALSSALFSVRVVHHVLLVTVMPPLLLWALPNWRPDIRGGLFVWLFAHSATFWAWHAPPAYEWALSNDFAYWLMQASLFASALGFWSRLRHANLPAMTAAVLLAMIQMGLLGALLIFTKSAVYAPHWLTTSQWGMTPLEDQQLGGLIMWVPASAIYLAATLMLARKSLMGRVWA